MNTKVFIAAVTVLLLVIIAGGYVMLNSNKDVPDTTSSETVYSADDVRQHDSKSDCWTIIAGNVYDITSYIPRHPGGDEILRACGDDATELFQTRTDPNGQPVGTGSPHSQTAEQLLAKLKVGKLQ